MATFETFEGLSVGDLNGQNSWSGSTNYDVQTSVVQEGVNAVSNAVASSNISKSYTAPATGSITWYMRTTASSAARRGVRFTNPSTPTIFICDVMFYNSSTVDLRAGGVDTSLGGYSANTWVKCEMEWNATQVRARINDGTWSVWRNPWEGSDPVPQTILLTAYSGGSGTVYYDNFTDSVAGAAPSRLLMMGIT